MGRKNKRETGREIMKRRTGGRKEEMEEIRKNNEKWKSRRKKGWRESEKIHDRAREGGKKRGRRG